VILGDAPAVAGNDVAASASSVVIVGIRRLIQMPITAPNRTLPACMEGSIRSAPKHPRMRLRIAMAISGLLISSATLAAQSETVAHVHVLDTLPIPSFEPGDVVIRPGDSVNWDNHAPRVHTVTHTGCPRIDTRNDSSACAFDTARDRGSDLDPGTEFTVTFPTPGVFQYVCAIHRFGGTITVLSGEAALPDLTVEALSAHPTPLGTSLRIEATLKNIGPGASAASRLRFEIRSLPDGAWQRFGDVAAPVLGPGQQVTLNQDLTTLNKVGDFEVRAVADGASTIVETDESNNARAEALSILLPQGTLPGVALPDPPTPQPVTTRLPSPRPSP
jgi:plastocyanin